MARVKGKVWISNLSQTQFNTIGIAYVRITLKNIVTNLGISVLTDEVGEYSFENVPIGNYIVVEEERVVFGDKIKSEDFSLATVIADPIPGDPKAERSLAALRAGGNKLQSLTANTVFVEIINDIDEEVVDFIDAPVYEVKDYKSGAMLTGENIFNFLDKGTCGTLPAGSMPNTSTIPSPYVDDVETSWNYFEFTGAEIGEESGYTIVNTLNMGDQGNGYRFFDLSDHSFGDERGRMLVLKHDGGRRTIISQSIPVKRNTNYSFSFWTANVVMAYSQTVVFPFIFQSVVGVQSNDALVQVYGKGLANSELVPVWREIASTFNSGANDEIVVSIEIDQQVNQPSYFAIDDITVFEYIEDIKAELEKKVDKTEAKMGDILTYNLVLKNTSNKDINNVLFTDMIPEYTAFQADSIEFDGSIIAIDPTLIAIKPLIKDGETATLTYKVKISEDQFNNLTITNTATAKYQFDGFTHITTPPTWFLAAAVIGCEAVTTTIVGEEKVSIASFTGGIQAVGKGYIPFYNILTSGNSVKVVNGYVWIMVNKPNSNYKISWTIDGEIQGLTPTSTQSNSYSVASSNSRICAQAVNTPCGLSGILMLNNQEIQDSIGIFEGCQNPVDKFTIMGETKVTLGISENYLTLKYTGVPCNMISITGATIKIVES